MNLSDNRNTTRWILVVISFVIIVLILWNTYSFFQIFKNEERIKMQNWAAAQKTVLNAGLETDIELPLKIIQNASIPILVIENDSLKNSLNVDEDIIKDPRKSTELMLDLQSQNVPIEIEYLPKKIWKLYYGDSQLLNKLKYYPLALVLIIVLFGIVVYNFFKSTKMSTQNKLWAGMAKETAHQIGTPLSSLIGWLEILKMENVSDATISELEKDINRLETITDRFSKIGSEPVLEICDIVTETEKSYNYLISRFSKQINFSFQAPTEKINVALNPVLHSWTIENLIKNAIDAMKGKGKIDVTIKKDFNLVCIRVSDSGKGIPKKQFNRIFEPGFTSKKRGWGLGLSLSKRIVEEYHKGEIKVLHSEIDHGTTFQIIYKITT